jgi:hypothetical protein
METRNGYLGGFTLEQVGEVVELLKPKWDRFYRDLVEWTLLST